MPIASEKHVKSESLCACCRCAIKICAADTGFRQLQFNVCSGREVAGQMRNKRPHLFVTGRHHERRRPAVALHPDDIEIFLRLPQFLFVLGRTVPQLWRFGSISGASASTDSVGGAMLVRISLWKEKSGRLPALTMMQPMPLRTNGFPYFFSMLNMERRVDVDAAGIHQFMDARTKLAACFQCILFLSAVSLLIS